MFKHTDSDTIARGAFTLTATTEHDSDSGAPWDNSDGHGPVSDWTTRDKLPGELILSSDRSSKRFYDFAAAVQIARKDGWASLYPYSIRYERTRNGSHIARGIAPRYGLPDIASKARRDINVAVRELYDIRLAQLGSKRAMAANAAIGDYEYLRGWCNDQWSYVGVIVTATHTRTGVECGSASLWGVETSDTEYPTSVANELIDEALNEARATIAALTEYDR